MPENRIAPDVVTIDDSVFERSFAIHSLVLVGTLEKKGEYNLAPKHMVTPLGGPVITVSCVPPTTERPETSNGRKNLP